MTIQRIAEYTTMVRQGQGTTTDRRRIIEEHRTTVAAAIDELTTVLAVLDRKIEDRAGEVQSVLARRGQHRAPSIPDLLIGATAELADLTVLHLDKDFELIAQISGQPVEHLDIEQ